MYVILIITLLFFFIGIAFLNEFKKNSLNFTHVSTVLIFFVLILIMGFRYDVGIDYKTYESWFYNEIYGNNLEWIYNFLNYFIHELTNEFVVLTLTISFITNIFVYLGLRAWGLKNLYLFLGIVIYVSSTYFFFANIMRQGVAVAIFLYASSFIISRNWKKYIFLILLASGFHISALILIPLYFIKFKAIKLKSFILLILICYYLIYSQLSQQIFNFFISISPFAGSYTGHEFIFQSEVDVFSLNVLGKVLLSILLLGLVNKSIYKESNNIILYYQLGILIYILSLSTFMYGRVSIYFQIFEVVAIPYIISGINSSKVRSIIYIITFGFMLMWIIYILFITPEGSNLIYKTIFEK